MYKIIYETYDKTDLVNTQAVEKLYEAGELALYLLKLKNVKKVAVLKPEYVQAETRENIFFKKQLHGTWLDEKTDKIAELYVEQQQKENR